MAKTGITQNAWHHLAMTYDGSLIKGYANGEFKESKPQSGLIRSTTKSTGIGQYGNAYWFKGIIDEVACYNRALTEKEIKQDMERGILPTAVSPLDKLTTTWSRIKGQ